jgi:hypothetical protein
MNYIIALVSEVHEDHHTLHSENIIVGLMNKSSSSVVCETDQYYSDE